MLRSSSRPRRVLPAPIRKPPPLQTTARAVQPAAGDNLAEPEAGFVQSLVAAAPYRVGDLADFALHFVDIKSVEQVDVF